jgi:hypothetical protein
MEKKKKEKETRSQFHVSLNKTLKVLCITSMPL